METKTNTNQNPDKSRKVIRIVISILVAIALWVYVCLLYTSGEGPEGGRQSGKQPGRAVHAEGDGQPGGKM